MKYDEYNQVINSEETYKEIAKRLNKGIPVIIGWTDEKFDHRDILFTYSPRQYGSLQRGLKWCYLYVSIMNFSSMGFLIELNRDNKKENGYIMEKLNLHDNECDNKICDLINGVIEYLDPLRLHINR